MLSARHYKLVIPDQVVKIGPGSHERQMKNEQLNTLETVSLSIYYTEPP
jgi:hypothetical protein